MKYDALYPDAPEDFESEPLDGFPPVIKLPECDEPSCNSSHKCEICGTKTTWTNGTSDLFVCSRECNKAMWTKLLVGLIAQQIVKGP
jgi:hypothetical protein